MKNALIFLIIVVFANCKSGGYKTPTPEQYSVVLDAINDRDVEGLRNVFISSDYLTDSVFEKSLQDVHIYFSDIVLISGEENDSLCNKLLNEKPRLISEINNKFESGDYILNGTNSAWYFRGKNHKVGLLEIKQCENKVMVDSLYDKICGYRISVFD